MKKPTIEERKQFDTFYKPDTAFMANARLRQSQWRKKKNLKKNEEPRAKYGNFIETNAAKEDKSNFLTENIKNLVTNKIAEVRKNGGLIGEPRIWNNLLSSQPLCFNLFGEMALDLKLATSFFKKLFPNEVSEVTKIDFEYSSMRNNPDNSAFDVYVEYLKNNKNCFFGIEVKFGENMQEESKAKALTNFDKHKEQYTDLTKSSKFYVKDAIEELSKPPIAQIWRDHLLAYNMSNNTIDGSFIFLYPFKNIQCHKAVTQYQKHLTCNDESKTKFRPRDLNQFIETLDSLVKGNWIADLKDRYII